MLEQVSFRKFLVASLLAFAVAPAYADISHVRIVRLSAVQGDVRFAENVKGDPLTASGASWQNAVINLPIREGYVLATDNGRAAVEFENGAMAFLAEHTVVQFYDLSLEDGARTTRLILRQGSAEFTLSPARGEFFSVTGGDFSVQADGRTTFRLNNFDDGSNVQVMQGHVSVLTQKKDTPVAKGQSLSMKAGDPGSEAIAGLNAQDDFDRWAHGQMQVTAAASAASRNTNYSGYLAGFGDLYTYGAWYPVAGYGSCWMPFGASLGWSPFDYGNWYFDSVLGWTFVGNQLWGWLPYHYGGWISAPGYGWCWSPGFYGNYPVNYARRWRPVNAVWVHAGTLTGLVPINPMDRGRKNLLNLKHGVFPVTGRGVGNRTILASETKWKVEKKPPRDVFVSSLRQAEAPAPVETSMFASSPTAVTHGRAGTDLSARSAIMYDAERHRFVSSNVMMRNREERGIASGNARFGENGQAGFVPGRGAGSRGSVPERGRESFANVPRAPRPTFAPPSVPRATIMQRPSYGGGSSWGGGSARPSGGYSPRMSAPSPRPVPRAPAPSSSAGRPH